MKDRLATAGILNKTLRLGGKLMMSTLNDVHKNNYKVTFDKFLSSIQLMEGVLSGGIFYLELFATIGKDFHK